MAAVTGSAALQVVMLWIPAARRLLDLEPLDAIELAIVLASSTVVFLVVEAGKVMRRRGITR
jgi:hypothetical protein